MRGELLRSNSQLFFFSTAVIFRFQVSGFRIGLTPYRSQYSAVFRNSMRANRFTSPVPPAAPPSDRGVRHPETHLRDHFAESRQGSPRVEGRGDDQRGPDTGRQQDRTQEHRVGERGIGARPRPGRPRPARRSGAGSCGFPRRSPIPEMKTMERHPFRKASPLPAALPAAPRPARSGHRHAPSGRRPRASAPRNDGTDRPRERKRTQARRTGTARRRSFFIVPPSGTAGFPESTAPGPRAIENHGPGGAEGISPRVTPGATKTLAAIQQPLPTVIGAVTRSKFSERKRCDPVQRKARFEIATWEPIVTGARLRIITSSAIQTWSPSVSLQGR